MIVMQEFGRNLVVEAAWVPQASSKLSTDE
jgi:hypothetical protein